MPQSAAAGIRDRSPPSRFARGFRRCPAAPARDPSQPLCVAEPPKSRGQVLNYQFSDNSRPDPLQFTAVLERLFHLTDNRTTVRAEVVAGVTTFLTMAYIIFVQPAVLSAAGMDFGSVLVATCLASGIATLLMAFLANYPIAVAPAMGHNFFFAFTVVGAMGIPWQVALGGVAIAGIIFILTAGIGLREHLIKAIPASLKHAIAVGIGLLIALIGLQWGGLVVDSPGTLVTLGNLKSPPALLTLFGLLTMAVLLARRVRGAMLIGILASTIVGLATGLVQYQGFVSAPPSLAPTF